LAPNAIANFIACDENVIGSCGATGQVSVDNYTVTFSQTFTYGTPFVLASYLQASIMHGCVNFNNCNPSTHTGSGTIDFYNTATLQPFQVLDASGTPNFGAIVTGEDGSIYQTVGPTAVPEPGTLALMSLGGLAVARRLRLRR
jgi:hypothetical protein